MPLWLDVEGRAVVSEGDPMEWGVDRWPLLIKRVAATSGS